MDRTQMSTRYAGQIETGWDVHGSDGEKIGITAAAQSAYGDQYFVIEKGFLFPSELYVPFSAIDRIDDDDVYLNVSKDDVEAQRWDQVPDMSTTDSRGEYNAALSGYQDRSDERDTLERREERLTVDKQQQQAGSVQVGKRVVEEQQAVDVPVTREKVNIETRSVDRPASGEAFTEESIEVPVYEDQVRTSKDARVVEELDVEKTARTDTQRVEDTVRREEFDIDTEGDADVHR